MTWAVWHHKLKPDFVETICGEPPIGDESMGVIQPPDSTLAKKIGQLHPPMRKLLEECLDVLAKKGADYSTGGDRLGNFKTAAKALGRTPREIWAVYFWKHVDAVMKHASTGRLESEPIGGRLCDAVNYLLLYALLVSEEAGLEP